MRTRIILSLMASFLLASFARAEDGWVSLFDGKSLDGWIQKNGTAKYEVKDGAVVGTTNEGSPNSFLCTKKDYGDFELQFEVKVHDQLNSGVQIRSQTAPTDDGSVGRVNGPQVEIEAGEAEAGYVYGEGTDRGWLTAKERLIPHKHFKNGEWNKFRVAATGPRIQTWINDEPIEDLTDEPIFKTHPKGFIGLQVHGIGKGTGPFQVSWRNIRLREIQSTAAAIEIPKPTGDIVVDARLELLFTRTAPIQGGLTEGPAVAPDGRIFFSDIPLAKDLGLIMVFDPKTKQTSVFASDSGKSNGLICDAEGNLLACEGADYGGRRVSRRSTKATDSTNVESKTIADRYNGKRFNAPNDLCLDKQGRIYFSDPRYLGDEPRELEHRAVYRIDKDGTVIEITHDIQKPNGIAISPDGKTLYVADHDNGTDKIDFTKPAPLEGDMKIYSWSLDDKGLVTGKRKTFHDFGEEKGCDGMCVDEQGNVYLTGRSSNRPGVLVLNKQGKEVAHIPTGPTNQQVSPEHPAVGMPSNVEFGVGDELNVLYITVDKSLYRIPLKVIGHHAQFQ